MIYVLVGCLGHLPDHGSKGELRGIGAELAPARSRNDERTMDLLAQAADGFRTLSEIDPTARQMALHFLTTWLIEAELAPWLR